MYSCLFQCRANLTWNQNVREKIKEEVQLDKENTYSVGHIESMLFSLSFNLTSLAKFVSAAVKRYFESRKRLYRSKRLPEAA